MDKFFSKKYCDRCGKPLTSRIMSMYNEDCICMECKEEETKRPDYEDAVMKDIEEHMIKLNNKKNERLVF